MKTIKVSDLQPGPQMDALVAEAREWRFVANGSGPDFYILPDGSTLDAVDYNPSGNGGQCFDLIKDYDIALTPPYSTIADWGAIANGTEVLNGNPNDIPRFEYYGETPEIAICKAVIASRFGETVEV